MATPVAQLLRWQIRRYLQPIAIIGPVPNPKDSAPKIAALITSSPVLRPPSACNLTLCRRLLSLRAWCASDRPSSHGDPAYRIEERGLAPVPPSWPEIVIKSAYAFATPAAMVPTPGSETSFTDTRAFGLTCFKSKISCAKSSIE